MPQNKINFPYTSRVVRQDDKKPQLQAISCPDYAPSVHGCCSHVEPCKS